MASSTTGLTQIMQTYYDREFLARAEAELRHDFGAVKKTIPANSGKTVNFTKFSTLAAATTPLTEGTNPSAVDMTANTVSATIAEYGSYVIANSLFEMTSLDTNLKEHVELMGYNAGFTLDTLIAAQLSANATTQLAGAKSNITAVAATDTLTGAEIRKAVRTLKTNKARRFSNGYFKGIIQPYTAYDLMGSSEWLNAHQYADLESIKKGAIGRYAGVEFVETNSGSTQSSTVTVYHNFVFGEQAFGIVELAGQPGSRIYVKQSGPQDTSNPLNMYSTVGWKAYFAAKVLDANWIVNVKCGATA